MWSEHTTSRVSTGCTATASGSASRPSRSPHVRTHCVNVDSTIKTAMEHFRYPPCPPSRCTQVPLPHVYTPSISSCVRGLGYKKYLMVSVVNTRFFNVYSSPFSTSHILLALVMPRILQPPLPPLLLCISGTLSPQPDWLDSLFLCSTPASPLIHQARCAACALHLQLCIVHITPYG